MQHIADHPELLDLVEQELANAPGPVLEAFEHASISKYDENLREMHRCLLRTLSSTQSRNYV